MKETALKYLRTALGNPKAEFRAGQWESIEALLDRKRLLVVQRTGWGKSMVYFIATRLLRDRGEGASLLVSPLLSLMRNQLLAAEAIGVRAATINSTNPREWDDIEKRLGAGELDILLVSPERLANDQFRENVLPRIARRVGMFVVDEAHCISDWGHDFRPDYRRIVRVLEALPANVPVLATTATANDRVVRDVLSQLGENIKLVRGPLVRKSLKLQNIAMPSPAARMAWLAEVIPDLPGSGIIYTLTIRDAERVAGWLRINDVSAQAYHARLETADREELEQQLLDNDVKALVATVALGMGFDKPDLGFVIHFQRPASVVHYYQQVGRAGRAVAEACGVLLHGEEDDRLADYFIRTAFPPQQHLDVILDVLDASDAGLSAYELQRKLNLRKGQLDSALKFLSVESPSPVTKVDTKWNVTAAARDYQVDTELISTVTAMRESEQQEMVEYMEHSGCLMEFLSRALDDPAAGACGKCQGCEGRPLLPTAPDTALTNRAAIWLRRNYQRLRPRRRWPYGATMPEYGFAGTIGEDLRAETGRALCLWRDAGWGELVADGKYGAGRFDDELVAACVAMIADWSPDPAPQWVTFVPSRAHVELIPDFAARLAAALELPFAACLTKIGSPTV